jgi:hypothetical protein
LAWQEAKLHLQNNERKMAECVASGVQHLPSIFKVNAPTTKKKDLWISTFSQK